MNKQTSIEWLQECLSSHLTHEQQMQFEGLFQQALAMEKEQIEDAYHKGFLDIDYKPKGYYNETYKGGQEL